MDSLQVQDGTVRPGVYLYHSAQTASLAPQNPEQVNLTSAQRQVGLQDVGQDTPLTGPNIQHISHASNSTPRTHDTSAVRAYVGATYHAGDRFARDDLVPIPPGPPRHRNPRRPSGYHCNECGRAFDRMRELKYVQTISKPSVMLIFRPLVLMCEPTTTQPPTTAALVTKWSEPNVPANVGGTKTPDATDTTSMATPAPRAKCDTHALSAASLTPAKTTCCDTNATTMVSSLHSRPPHTICRFA